MADTVRYLMEAMVPELEALKAKGYFSKQELRSIAQQRTNFEYALKRKQALLQDYVKYAEYEMQLEELRRTRRKTRGIGGKRSLADYCISRRVHFIYERATRKFRGNLALWMTWLKHCRSTKSNIQFSKVIVKALRLHPNQPDLWICAAAWEFDVAANPSAARTFMQRGLRNCPTDTRLWAEYFDMELLYAGKLRARRAALGIQADGPSSEAAAVQDAASAAVLNGAVAEVVMQRMLQEHPDVVGAAESLLRVLWRRAWSWTQHLEGALLAAVAMRSDQVPAVELLARAAESSPFAKHASAAAGVKEACAVFEEALQSHPSPAMYDAAVGFGMARLQSMRQAEGKPARKVAALLLQWTSAVCADAQGKGMATDAVFEARHQLECHAGNASALPALVAAWTAAHPASEAAALCSLQHSEALSSGKDASNASAAVVAVLRRVPSSPAVWQAAAELAVANVCDSRVLGEELVQALVGRSRGPLEGGLGDAVRAVLHALLHTHGIAAAHALCRRLLTVPAASCRALLCMADVYADVAAGRVPLDANHSTCASPPARMSRSDELSTDEDDQDSHRASDEAGTLTEAGALHWEAKVLARAVEEYGANAPHVWLRLMEAEETQGRGGAAVYERACKSLRGTAADAFVQLATQRRAG